MSVARFGFTASQLLPANSMLRVTLEAREYFFLTSFQTAAKDLHARMYAVTGIIPSSHLSVVSSDTVAVVDGIIHRAVQGAELVNKLETLSTMSAEVTRVELLSAAQKQDSTTDAGGSTREDAAEDAAATKAETSLTGQLEKFFAQLGTAAKWTAVIVGVVAVAYAVGQFRGVLPRRR